MAKRKQLDGHPLTNTITAIDDLRSGHHFLAPYEYSSTTIGIQNYLLRYCENEPFMKFFHQGVETDLPIKGDFIIQLNNKEKTLSNKCHLDIERCAMIARLRMYLEQNDGTFQNILKQSQNHLCQSMQEDPPPSPPKTPIEFIQQCNQRNEAAMKLQLVHRMRCFQFHDDNDVKQSMNIINLQKWILTHFQLFSNIIPKVPDRTQLIPHLNTLINNSFVIIQHPSPPIITHSRAIEGSVTAAVYCRLLCLLDQSNPVIKIDNIIPVVHRLTTYYQIEESDTVYQQPEMVWKTYSIVTASNSYKTFSCAELLKINLAQTSTASANQKLPTGHTHFAPYVYNIVFHINVTVRFANDPLPYKRCVIVQSAPFGLITHTSQEEDLFAKVFIEDRKSWRSSLTMGLDDITSSPTTMDLTVEEIVDSIKRHFIHKTGIRPQDWVMPYIEHVLTTARDNQPGSIESLCHNHLVKILAQINYMTKHPLLSLFHADGLFLGICDSDTVSERLFNKRIYCQKSICAIRFGALSRTSDLKNIGIRIDRVEKWSSNPQKYTFDTTKLPFELGLFIIKISLCEASDFNSILTSLNTNVEGSDRNGMENITKFVELYHSEKLLQICPHKERYTSIWNHFYNNENEDASNSDPSIASDLSSNYTIVTTTGANVDRNNLPYNPWNSNLCPFDPPPSQLYHPQHQMMTSQINQTNTNPSPIIIVVTNPNQCTMSNEDLNLLVKNRLPQYSQLIHSSPIHRIDVDQTYSPNSTSFDDLFDFLYN